MSAPLEPGPAFYRQSGLDQVLIDFYAINLIICKQDLENYSKSE